MVMLTESSTDAREHTGTSQPVNITMRAQTIARSLLETGGFEPDYAFDSGEPFNPGNANSERSQVRIVALMIDHPSASADPYRRPRRLLRELAVFVSVTWSSQVTTWPGRRLRGWRRAP